MNLMKWEPFQDMEGLFNRYYDWPRRVVRRQDGDSEGKLFDWRPSVDISETKKQYVIKAELPEVEKDDVEVTIDSGLLTISGERNFESEDDDETRHRIERMYGRFSRSFTLPSDADADKIAAKNRNGVLKVIIPKLRETRGEAVKISVE